jgi:hypothetical protein
MKNIHRTKKNIKDLAKAFDKELEVNLPVAVLPNKDLLYKQYVVKQTKDSSWAIIDVRTRESIDEFFLKSCALMAAKAYSVANIKKYIEVKTLDRNYSSNYNDTIIFGKNLKSAKDLDRYIILLNKLDLSKLRVEQYKDEITKMFKWSFA